MTLDNNRLTVDTEVTPRGTLELLSKREVESIISATPGSANLRDLFRRCALAVLNTDSESDDAAATFDRYADFDVEVVQRTRGLKLKINNAPASAFVDRRMIEGVRQHLFAVLRDIVYLGSDIVNPERFDLTRGDGITDAVFHILKHARVLQADVLPNLVVCWGGHAISREEYEYSKSVGYELGLRGLDICTGCGPGAMKGPMKGAAIGHAKQRVRAGRFVGLTEPGIIAAEPPNPIVRDLVILPDIEKRLEAFVRIGHGIVVFPGGVGTAEEVLFLLGILMMPENREARIPVFFTGPASAKGYFDTIDHLIVSTLGKRARRFYQVVVDDPAQLAKRMQRRIREVKARRLSTGDAFYFNWLLNVPESYQLPFEVTHESVSKLELSPDLESVDLAGNLRKAFSALVTGNVKADGIRSVQRDGPFEIYGDKEIMTVLDEVLRSFVAQGRMKLERDSYDPCYRLMG